MATTRGEQPHILGGEHRRAEIDPADRAARALADTILVERDDDRRPAELLLQPPGNNADHAGMPAAARDHRDGAVALGQRLYDLGLLPGRPSSIVRRSSFSRSSSAAIARASSSGSSVVSSADAEIGLADAPARIDPRPQREAEIGAGRRAIRPRRLDQGGDADVAASGHDPDALRDERPVEPAQRGDIGDSAERYDVEQFH